MAKQTKTPKKATTARKKTSKIVKDTTTKSVPSVKDSMSKLMIIYNNYQQYRKESGKSYTLATKDIIETYAKLIKPEQIKALRVAIYTINNLQDDLYYFATAYYKAQKIQQEVQNQVEYTTWLEILTNGTHPTDLPKEDRK